jgi:hypothetical protein|tara:strand:- start:180 stop:797 length:618 start_codon:yes stop_codon:yes gene_type:complete
LYTPINWEWLALSEGERIMGSLLKGICSALIAILVIFNIGCSNHHVDTVSEWCEQIAGVDLAEKNTPFWAVLPSVSFDGDAIRDDFTASLNEVYLQKVENSVPKGEKRTPRMAWREGTELHLVSLYGYHLSGMQEFIGKWQKEIELAKEFKHTDSGDICFFRTLTSMFDSLHIHTAEFDGLGKIKDDYVTVILTDREARLGDNRL